MLRANTLALGLILVAAQAHAFEVVRPRSWDELRALSEMFSKSEFRTQDLVRALNARVIEMDRHAIENEFAQTRTMNDEQLKAWLIAEFAFVASPYQGRPSDVAAANFKMATAESSRGGAMLIGLGADSSRYEPKGLVEVKGLDNDVTLESATAQIQKQRWIQSLYDIDNFHNAHNLQTIETYFVIEADNTVLLGRQASVGLDATRPTDSIVNNAQRAATGTVIDFENIAVQNRDSSLISKTVYRAYTTLAMHDESSARARAHSWSEWAAKVEGLRQVSASEPEMILTFMQNLEKDFAGRTADKWRSAMPYLALQLSSEQAMSLRKILEVDASGVSSRVRAIIAAQAFKVAKEEPVLKMKADCSTHLAVAVAAVAVAQ